MKLIDKLILPVALALIVSVAGIVARVAVAANASAQPEGIELPIVMYHHILKDQSRLNKYTISPDEFRRDMQYLQDNGYESFHEYAYPILKEFGFKAVFSVVGTYADQYTRVDDHHIRYSHCTWNQLALLQESGLVEVQNHSYNLHLNENGRHGAKMKRGESPVLYQKLLSEDLSQMQKACQENLRGWTPSPVRKSSTI